MTAYRLWLALLLGLQEELLLLLQNGLQAHLLQGYAHLSCVATGWRSTAGLWAWLSQRDA